MTLVLCTFGHFFIKIVLLPMSWTKSYKLGFNVEVQVQKFLSEWNEAAKLMWTIWNQLLIGILWEGEEISTFFFSFYNGVRCEYSIFIVNGFNENKTFAKIHQNKKKSNIEDISLVCTKIFSVFSWYLHFTMKMGQNNGVVINIIFNCVVA